MKTKHTPGPWTVYVDPKMLHLASVLDHKAGEYLVRDTSHPNARLIAAAPDAVSLFEDLQDYLLEHGGEAVELFERVDAWLAKAKGQ